MKKIFLTLFLIVFINSPSFSIDLLCKVSGLTCQRISYKNLILKNNFYYEKYKNEKYTGYVSGIETGFVKNGLKEGTWEIYFKSGEIKRKTNYNKGIKEGFSEKYFKNGIIKNKTKYKNGIKNGIYNQYYKNGELKYWTEYQDGKRNGEYEEFKNETLIVKGNYKNDLREGEWSYKDIYGKTNKKTWVSGKLKSGLFSSINGTGGQIENFKKEGYWKEYQNLGISEGNYKNNERDGFWKVIESFMVYSKGEYLNGNKHGKWERYWKSTNTLLNKENYRNNMLEGKRLTYFRNGKINRIVNYKNGSKEGDYEIFFSTGVTCERGTYKNNLKKIEFSLSKSITCF